jgi:hypothetical protein
VTRRLVALVGSLVAAAILCAAGPAGAQTSEPAVWWEQGYPPSRHVVGDRVAAGAEVHRVPGQGWIGDGPWFVTLVSWEEASRPGSFAPEGLELTRASVHAERQGTVASVSFSYVVPRVDSGEYGIVIASRAPSEAWGVRLGDFTGEWVRISQTPEEARLAELLTRMNDRSNARLDRVEGRVETIAQTRAGASDLGALEDRVLAAEQGLRRLGSLEDELARARAGGRRSAAFASAATALLALGLWRGRRFFRERARPELDDGPAEVVPFELEPAD